MQLNQVLDSPRINRLFLHIAQLELKLLAPKSKK